jgi:hypothetical protein
MGTNPFDRALSSQPREEKAPNAFSDLNHQIEQLLLSTEHQRQAHQEAWGAHKQLHHEKRLEQALEREAANPRFLPTNIRKIYDAEDDRRFSYLTNVDQLLELRTHEEYLRGRRAWERRRAPKPTSAPAAIEKRPLTKARFWGYLTLAFVLFLDVLAVFAGPGGLLFVLISPLVWVFLFRTPLLADGMFSGGRASDGRAV